MDNDPTPHRRDIRAGHRRPRPDRDRLLGVWCGPCRAMAPQFEKAAELRPQYRFAKVDVDAEPALASAYAVRSIPTLIVLRDGEPIAAQAGLMARSRSSRRLTVSPAADNGASGR